MAEWKKVVVSGSAAELASINVTNAVTASYFVGDGSGLTGVQASGLNIEGFTNGTGITVAATDKLLLSDAGTEKYITVSQLFDTSDFDSEVGAVIAASNVVDLADVNDAGSGEIITDAERTKLSGIADGAEVNTVDSVNTQTGAVVLDADDISDSSTTNKFTTSAEITKLAGIETGADVTDTTNVRGAGALMDDEVTNLAQVKAFDSSDYATAAQGALADSALQDITGESVTDLTDVTSAGSGAIITTTERSKLNGIAAGAEVNVDTNITVVENTSTVEIQSSTGTNDEILAATTSAAGVMSSADKTKLDGIETNADVTDVANVEAALGSISVTATSDVTSVGSGAIITSTERTKLNGIETNADVTDSTNVQAAGALMDSELTNESAVKAINQGLTTSSDVSFRNIVATGDLTVQGTLTSVQTTNLNVEDQIVLIGSGSTDARDAGFVFGGSNGTANSGDAFFYDMDTDRPAWSSDDVAWNATSIAPTAFIPRVFDSDLAHTPIAERGSIKVEATDIYIYV